MSTQRPLFVQLGRAGDIFNTLPLAERIAKETGEKCLYMTAKEFAGILEGASYVEPVIFNGPFEDFVPAMFQARKLTTNIIVGQIYGRGLANAQTCTSFARESWASANAPVPWGSLPLNLDQRDADREDLAVQLCGIDPARKLVVLSLGGISSPFPHARFVRESLALALGPEYQVVDLAPIKVLRLYDFLAVFERAHCLVTVDTGTLHLAHACDVPVVSLINPYPTDWHASPWRPNHVARIFYHEIPAAFDKLVERVRNARVVETLPRIVHVWADFRDDDKPDHENNRRVRNAQASWDQEYANAGGRWFRTEFPIGRNRTSKEVGDPKPVPFIADMVNHAVPYCRKDDDIIGWTNSDVSFAPGLTGHVLEKCERYGCAFTHRWDFPALSRPFLSEAMVRRGKWYPGSDAFFFTLRWWRQNAADYPDLLMGREHNDEIFRTLMKKTAGVECEIEAAIYHEKHASYWEVPENFKTNPGNNHNRALAHAWFKKHDLKPNDFQFWTKRVDRETRG